MPSIKFNLIQLTVWEKMSFEDFPDGHIGYLKVTILESQNLHFTIKGEKKKKKKNKQKKNNKQLSILFFLSLAIQNLHVSPMAPTNFQLTPTPFGSRCGLKILKTAAIIAIFNMETEQLQYF